jgi:uncharacterized protein YjiS (DUF1127 family)
MSTIWDQTTRVQAIAEADGFWIRRIIRRWWQACLTSWLEPAAIAQLSSMSDRELKDIGLTRYEITSAVKGKTDSQVPSFLNSI